MARLMTAILAAAPLSLNLAFADGEAPAPTTPQPTGNVVAMSASEDLDEIVINGIRRGDLILPTTVTSTSAYGLDLGVMDTPRNNTLLSKAQLDALNVNNPGGFSYLTSSSYSDASFGEPNVPRIRGQYADMFFNGMRDSFTLNGYGAPISFNSVDSIDIVKGPASVQGGAGAGVGGSINIVTKMPSLTKSTEDFSLEFDTQQKRIAIADVGGPLGGNLAGRVSVEVDDSGSYYYDMFFHQQSLFAALLDQISPKFSILTTADYEATTYRENDGVNRVNQTLIDNGLYLAGGPVGGPGAIEAIDYAFTQNNYTGYVPLNRRIIIDEPDGTGAKAQHIKGQVIATYDASDNFSVVNNTFYDYMNRYNQTEDYYADTAIGSMTIENKTDFKFKFGSAVSEQIDTGFTYRYAHVLDIQNFLNEPVSVFDLTANPNTWVLPSSINYYSGAILYPAAFGHYQWGVGGRIPYVQTNGTVDSNLQDAAIFLEHRLQFSPQLSMLYGLREDVVQLDYSDPFPDTFDTGLPQSASTGWYGLYNGNVSVVYSPTSHLSAYATYNKAEYVLPTANDGAVATWGVDPTVYLRQHTLLEEAGLKLDLLDKALFVSMAGFYQQRSVSNGPSAADNTLAHIKGAEIELNFQPNPKFFSTASYSYLHTTLDSPAGFWNFPAAPGINYDGLGTTAVFAPGQSFQDPGVPQQLFNLLANYKTDSGWGVQANIQVTGTVETTQSGRLNLAATNANAVADGFGGLPPALLASLTASKGYYQSPTIPWQYTLNGAVFYSFQNYKAKLSIYNLTNRRNVTNDIPFYGNDFLTQQPPRDFDLTISARF